jgi:O-antigen ligase
MSTDFDAGGGRKPGDKPRPGAPSGAPPSRGARLISGRAFVLAAGALLVVRMCLTAHAPSFVDAHASLAALVLAFVAGAPRPARRAATLCLFGALLSLPSSWDPWMSLLTVPAILGPMAFFLLASSGSCKSALLAGAGIGGGVNAVVAIVQRTITWPRALARMDELGLDAASAARLADARPIALSLSPDLAGGLCLVGAFCACALALDVDKRARVAMLVLAATSASGLLVVRSFGCTVALVVGVAVSALLFARDRPPGAHSAVGESSGTARAADASPGGKQAPRGRARAGLVAAIGLVIVAVALVVALMTRGAGAAGRSAAERVENWRAALDVLSEAPWFGVGLMRFGAAYLEIRGPETNVTRYTHSGPLQVLAETGVVGALLAAAALIVIGRAIWQRRAAFTSSDRVVCGAAAALVLRACVDYDLHVSQTASVLGVVVGLLIARAEPAPAEPLQRRAIAAVSVAALGLLLVLGMRQGVLESEDAGALTAYIDKLPLDTEPRIALGAQGVDALAICADHASCVAARKRAFDALDPLAARAHPPPVALVLRARANASIGHLDEALADVDGALKGDRGSAPAHRLGIALSRALKRNDVEARMDAARAWSVPVEDIEEGAP